ncbi:hypothetical protein H2202_009711 [Exophiala xenobiotica]|nr:hypothetical protein H2202_009711 [Exophiala xenobiotica]KAK5227852.1 hypothetical protein LTR47_008423 [Exophiala xenobiotica]KAK5253425.1 hypothetical protein LTS06_002136 [Exophiala xenobiotica]KAK5257846.1 hypothetical protein LTR40_009080 [Exophiala xenobiotica]KAK5317527.1 hypothetical protein LTR93_008738 [Exophiala xenobiotica]
MAERKSIDFMLCIDELDHFIWVLGWRISLYVIDDWKMIMKTTLNRLTFTVTGDGTVDVCKVGDLLSETVVQYPVPCFVGVTNYDNISDSFYGGNFTMASTAEGTPTTWALPVPTSNAAISSAATATSSPNDPSTSTQATAISSESNGPTNAPQISSSPSQTSAPSLSTGAKVGIAFGAIVTTAIIVSFIYFLRLHRRLKTRITTPSAWQNDQQRESASLMTLGTVELPNNQPPGCQPEAGGMHQSKSCDLKGQVSESMDEPIRYELGQH